MPSLSEWFDAITNFDDKAFDQFLNEELPMPGTVRPHLTYRIIAHKDLPVAVSVILVTANGHEIIIGEKFFAGIEGTQDAFEVMRFIENQPGFDGPHEAPNAGNNADAGATRKMG